MCKIEYPSGTRIRTYCLLVTGLLPLSDQGSSHPCKKTVFVANAECNHLQLQSHLSFLFDPTPLRIGYCGVANVHVPQPKGGFHRTVSPTYNRTSRWALFRQLLNWNNSVLSVQFRSKYFWLNYSSDGRSYFIRKSSVARPGPAS